MYPYQLFMLHVPYPDGTWRGLEKCSATSDGPRLFGSKEGAQSALDEMPIATRSYFHIVEVTLVTPAVRGALDSATFEKVKPLIPR